MAEKLWRKFNRYSSFNCPELPMEDIYLQEALFRMIVMSREIMATRMYGLLRSMIQALFSGQNAMEDQEVTVPAQYGKPADGRLYLGGYSFSNELSGYGHHGSLAYPDIWVLKLSASGIIEWQKSLGGTFQEQFIDIIPTYNGGYIVSGSTNSINGDVTGSPWRFYKAGLLDRKARRYRAYPMAKMLWRNRDRPQCRYLSNY
jgi:hypothetical protein